MQARFYEDSYTQAQKVDTSKRAAARRRGTIHFGSERNTEDAQASLDKLLRDRQAAAQGTPMDLEAAMEGDGESHSEGDEDGGDRGSGDDDEDGPSSAKKQRTASMVCSCSRDSAWTAEAISAGADAVLTTAAALSVLPLCRARSCCGPCRVQ